MCGILYNPLIQKVETFPRPRLCPSVTFELQIDLLEEFFHLAAVVKKIVLPQSHSLIDIKAVLNDVIFEVIEREQISHHIEEDTLAVLHYSVNAMLECLVIVLRGQ